MTSEPNKPNKPNKPGTPGTLSKRDVLPWLEPPPGGLAALRARLDRPRKRPLVWALAAAGATASVAGVTIALALWAAELPRIVVTHPDSAGTHSVAANLKPDPGPTGPTLDLERHPALAALPSEPVTVPRHARGQMAVTRAAPDTPEVLFYWVSPHTGRPRSH